MANRKRGKNEIICMCSAYAHPHRLGGGTCNGSAWCQAFRSIDAFDCESCNHNSGAQCDIVTGQDQLDNDTCECIAGEIRTRYLEDEYGYLPLDVEDYWNKKQREYYEGKE